MPRGQLKIFMGYAAGVGKTYRMLEEAQALRAEGVDVVIGYFEPHGRADTIARTEGLEIVPRRRIEYRGTQFEEMDPAAILARNPQVCAVDEFPHTNVPGSERAKRWEDVQVLLDAGIDVLTTMNVQHLESLNDEVFQITGIRVRETIPDWVVRQATEVVMMDLTPHALLNRLNRGVIYSRDKAEQARQNFFREPTLVALRELTLRQAAYEVDHRTTKPSRSHRILMLVTDDADSVALIRRAKRMGDFINAESFAVAVRSPSSSGLSDLAERHLNFARNLRIETRVLEGDDVAQTVVDFARRNQITQIFLARPTGPQPWLRLPSEELPQRIVRLARDMQVVIVARAAGDVRQN